MLILGRQLFEVRDQLRLRERGVEVEVAAEAHAFGDVLEEVLDRRDADSREHRVAVGIGEREVARHASPLLFVEELPVRLHVEEIVDLRRVRQANLHEPPATIRILVDRLGSIDDGLVHLDHLA